MVEAGPSASPIQNARGLGASGPHSVLQSGPHGEAAPAPPASPCFRPAASRIPVPFPLQAPSERQWLSLAPSCQRRGGGMLGVQAAEAGPVGSVRTEAGS